MYKELNEAGLARELIRAILPVNLYTEWYWKNDLHNLLHFIGLRSIAMPSMKSESTPMPWRGGKKGGAICLGSLPGLCG
ncbi:MAG: hypothetical protein CM1200mP10_20670 [Candidatus Neomarinimicrobiota bacterium]|nr:MAG: hypothetical protein CM1200mP10_20670 [Candidatus Neomarinimicrobiota bacterium]